MAFENVNWAHNQAKSAYQFGNSWSQRFGKTGIGRATQQGIMETLGWNYRKDKIGGGYTSQGFMGLGEREVSEGVFEKTAFSKAYETEKWLQGGGVRGGARALRQTLPAFARQAGARGIAKGAWGVIKHGGFLNAGFTAWNAIEGYREDGIVGAAKSVAIGGAIQIGMDYAMSTLALGAAFDVAAPLAAIGYGAYRVGKASIARGKRYRNLEMGTPFVDTFGTAATIRQRSLQAIQNSHIGGRMALGNEGALMHYR